MNITQDGHDSRTDSDINKLNEKTNVLANIEIQFNSIQSAHTFSPNLINFYNTLLLEWSLCISESVKQKDGTIWKYKNENEM